MWRRLLNGPRSRPGEAGFTLIEIVVAMAIFALLATFTASLISSGMRGVLLSKRREVATAEANKVFELARSLSYDSLGLSQNSDSTIATDSAIQAHGVGLLPSYQVGATWEPILWDTSGGGGGPFNPHQLQICPTCTVKRGNTSLTRKVYVTGVDTTIPPDGIIDLKRVTVLVSWNSSGTPGAANSVRAQTLVNPQGIISTAGLMPQTSSTSSTGGSATVTNRLAQLISAAPALGPVSISLPTTTGSSNYKAVSTISCTAKSTTISGLSNTYGGHSKSVTADDDAQTATLSSPPSDSWSGSPGDSLIGATDLESLIIGTPIVSPVSCAATASDPVDSLPYEKGTAPAAGSLNVTTTLTGAVGLPSTALSALVLAPQTVTQEIDHQTVNGLREVLSTSTSGQGTLNVLMIPGVFTQGLVQIDPVNGYSASVRSAEGLPSTSPTITTPGSPVVLRIYDPVPTQVTGCTSRTVDYCIINVDPHVGASKHPAGVRTFGLTTLTYDMQIDVLPPTNPVNGAVGSNGERRWSAQYAPISITGHLTVRVGAPSTVLTDTLVHVDLGSVSASACAGVTC